MHHLGNRTTFRRWFWESQMSCSFMMWDCMQLRYGNRCGECVLMCVQSGVQMVLGRPAMEPSLDWDLFFFSVGEFYVLCGQLIYSIHDSWESMADAFDMLTLSPSSLWNVPQAKKPNKTTCMCCGTGLDRLVWLCCAGSKLMQRSMKTALGSLKHPKRFSEVLQIRLHGPGKCILSIEHNPKGTQSGHHLAAAVNLPLCE